MMCYIFIQAVTYGAYSMCRTLQTNTRQTYYYLECRIIGAMCANRCWKKSKSPSAAGNVAFASTALKTAKRWIGTQKDTNLDAKKCDARE